MPIQPIKETRDYVVSTIRQVAVSQNADFRYLLNQARVESGLNPSARASTSSAAGLFQFTSGTWFDMVKRHGDKIGLVNEAQAIRSNTASPLDRSKILDLRNEPQTSTALAAFYAADNARALSSSGHKSVGPTELYLAHFLGSAGASTFLNGLRDNPGSPAAPSLPFAANANASVFYRNGSPRSFQEIYNRFADKFRVAAEQEDQPSLLAKAPFPPSNDNTGSFEQRFKQVIAAAIGAQRTTGVNPSEGSSSLTVSEEAMTKYLKNFSLADHASGMTQVSAPQSRDASRGASSNGSNPPLDEQSVSPLASGARMMLRAIDQQLKDNVYSSAKR